MVSKIAAAACLLLLPGLLFLSDESIALDNPHNISTTVNCADCHISSPNAIWWTDQGGEQGASRGICRSCHTSGGLGPYVMTHSSAAVSSTKYGTWDNKCTVCHNPHTQRQFRTYKAASYVYTGISTAVTADSLTKAGAGWTAEQWEGYILLPNVQYMNQHYRILTNTAEKITIDTGNGGIDAINLTYVRPGNTFAIVYDGLIKEAVGGRAVRFFNTTGSKSFADGDVTYDGICEVCHTRTQGAGGLARYRNTAHDDSHYESQKCTDCHRHEEGFKGSCTICHGNPPTDDSSLVGFASPSRTNSTTAGAHSKHVLGSAVSCGACHHNSVGSGVTHNNGDLKVTMGFFLQGAYQGGIYDGQSGVTYDASATSPATAVLGGGTRQCSNIYCHGNYQGSGLNASPVWDGPASGACGTCHGASRVTPPASGNHERHAGMGATLSTGNREFKCTLCHSGIIESTGPDSYAVTDTAKHVNTAVNWLFDTSDWRLSANPAYSIGSGAQPPSDGTTPRAYGTCTNVYCHSNVQPDGGVGPPVYDTPRWGDTTGGWGSTCSTCHNSGGHLEIYTGGHQSHIRNYYFGYSAASTARKCSLCHKYNAAAAYSSCNAHCHTSPEEILRHADGNVDIMFDTSKAGVSAAYDGSPVPGDGYGNCSNTYCHGNYSGSGLNAAPAWGDPATAVCGTCHKAKNNDVLFSGSHQKHAGNGTLFSSLSMWTNNREYACTLCHSGIAGGSGPGSYTIADTARHVNGVVDWRFDTSDTRLSSGAPLYSIASGVQPPSDGTTPRAYGSCSTIYCHSNVQPEGGVGPPDVYTGPQWGTVTGCYGCHAGTSGTDRSRHGNIHTGSHDSHVSVQTDATSECLFCHNWFTPSDTGSGCGSCHPAAGAANAERSLHADGQVTVIFRAGRAGSTAAYNGTPQPGDGYGTCSNIFCHGDGTHIRTGTPSVTNATPQWGSSAPGCNICHGNTVYPSPWDGMPAYANNAPKENSHVGHVIDNGIGCEFCHWSTTEDGTTIASRAYHGNANYSITGSGANRQYLGRDVRIRQYLLLGTKGTSPNFGGYCREISCHGSGWPVQSYQVESLYAYWGTYQKCGDCHMQKANISQGGIVGNGDVVSYGFGDGTHAMVDGDQWRYSGHGKTSGTYDVSLNPAANFGGAANCPSPPSPIVSGCDQCLYCHTDSASHNNAGNPFRLANYNVLGNGWNDACLVCHGTGSAGYDPDGGGTMALKNGSVKIDKYHFGADHGATNDGGSLCWDCHDSHGDRVAGSGNIFMIQKTVTVDKSDAFGRPSSTASPVFTGNAAGTNFIAAFPGPYTGVCNVCHTMTNHHRNDGLAPGDWDGVPGASNYIGHNNGAVCTACHSHSASATVDGGAFANP